MMSKGRDVSMFFPDVVKNVVSPSLEVKKLVYMFLVRYAEVKQELALLAINSFQKDMADKVEILDNRPKLIGIEPAYSCSCFACYGKYSCTGHCSTYHFGYPQVRNGFVAIREESGRSCYPQSIQVRN